MSEKRNGPDKKTILSIVIPAVIAVLVVVALAIAGNFARKSDIESPTSPSKPAITQQQPDAVSEDASVSIVAVGDNLIHNTCISAGKQDDGSYDYSSFYENISPYVRNADLAIINQETMLGGSDFEYTGYPLFNSPWEVGEAAIDAGFDVFTCATNHSMDKGSAGIIKECEFFSKHPEVIHIGTYTSESEYNTIAYMEKNGIRFAFLNYTYGTNGISIPSDKPYLISMLTEDRVRADITKARENADVVIVLPHWGTENSHDVNDSQRKYVKIFAELGVDIVIGTHPHVLQPVEWVTRNDGKKMLVYYSIGNFVSHQVNLNQMCGGMAEITVERKDGEIEITTAKLAPVIDFYSRSGSGYRFSVYKFGDYTSEIAANQAQSGTTVDYFEKLSRRIIDDEFLDME